MVNILDIIQARRENILTEPEAKSYIQRIAESEIQEVEAQTKLTLARAESELYSECDDCDCCEEECPTNMTAAEIEAASAPVDEFIKWLVSHKA